MKTALTFFFAFCFAMGAAFCQEKLDVVQLKNGVVYKGKIIGSPNGDTLKLRDSPSSVLFFAKSEIGKISYEYPGFSSDSLGAYGGKISIGEAIGGGGLFGVPVRVRMGKANAFEAGLFFRPFLGRLSGGYEFKRGFAVAGAFNLGMNKKYKPLKQKIIANGVFFRAVGVISKYKESLFGFGWASERFRLNNKSRSFISELGPGLIIRHWVTDPDLGFSPYTNGEVGFVLFWKISWFAHSK
jgi:hypothetical protein